MAFKKANKTVIYTSHYMPEIEKICDDVAIINAGQIIKHGSIESMLTNESADQIVIEIYETPLATLEKCCVKMASLNIIDENTLMLTGKKSQSVSESLTLLESHSIGIKNIRYGTTTLESLFINLTSKGRADV